MREAQSDIRSRDGGKPLLPEGIYVICSKDQKPGFFLGFLFVSHNLQIYFFRNASGSYLVIHNEPSLIKNQQNECEEKCCVSDELKELL